MILCNRADLVRIVKDPENGNLETAAAFMGYFREPDSVSRRLPVPPPGGPPSRKSAQDFSPPETDPCHNLAPLPFWRAVRYETKQETPKEASSTETPPAAFSFSELQQQRASLRPVPKTKQWLSPWSVLLPKMALLIKEKRQGHEVDTDAVVKQWSGGVMLSKIPRRYRARWPRRIQVVVDRSRRLTPFWHDQDEVVSRLKRLIGPKCVDEYRLFDGLREPLLLTGKKGGRRPFQPVAGDTTLVLGDGGALSSVSGDARLWEEFALRLLRGGVTPKMLDPSPQYRACAGSSRKWLREGWEKGSLSSPPQGSLCERVKRLLTVISPAVRVEPGLLRKLRSLLPPEWTDAGTEADLWSHPALQSDSSVALTINAERLENLREGFYNLFSNDEKRCVAVLKTIWNWHAGLNPEVRYEELLSIRGEELSAHFPEEKGEAENYMARLAATLYSSPSEEGRPRAQGEMRAWLRRFKDRTLHVPRLWNPGTTLGTEMQKAANHLFEGDEKTETSGKWEVDSEGIPLERERIWKGAQTGSRLTLETVDQSEPESFSKKGSPLGFFKTTRPLFHAVVERNTPASSPHRAEGTLHRVDGKNNLSLSFPTGDQWTLETDRGDLHFEKMTRPGWADEIGRDEFGLWVSFSLGRATQKMRWIPPGEFLMGSPEREEGRLKGEILHPVVLSRGFWLMDTAVVGRGHGKKSE
ncbi:MAG: hypothetical protein ACE5FU_01985 [Nitrospinota bacterium]